MKEYTVKVYDNGHKEWCLNGKYHREDGPAIEWADGQKEWYLNGKQLTKQKFLERTQPTKELTVADVEKLLGYKVKIVKE